MLSGVKKNKIRVLAVNFAVRYRCINVVHTVHKILCAQSVHKFFQHYSMHKAISKIALNMVECTKNYVHNYVHKNVQSCPSVHN